MSEFSVGDRVVSNGPHADLVKVPKNLCARIPDGVDDEAAAFVTPDCCQCERKTIVCVRNALATMLGEPQVPYTDGARRKGSS